MRSVRVFILLTSLFFAENNAFARYQPDLYESASKGSVRSKINQVVEKTNGDVGVYVKSMNTGRVLYSYNASRVFSPASTMKVMTAEAALIFLGKNYRFVTQLYSDQPAAEKGVLKGNVFIAQNGDPTLTYRDIQSLVRQLKANGIHTIRGNLYIDHTAFDQSIFGQNWEAVDKQRCYGAPIGAGMVNKNCVHFQITPAKKAGALAEIRRSPLYFYPTIHNQVVTKNVRRGRCALKINSDSLNSISLKGCMPKGRYAWGVTYVVSDLAEYNRSLYRNAFQQAGIRVTGSVSFAPVPKKKYLLAEHASKPMSELVREMLKKSDNIIASAIFKKIGQLYTRRIGSWQTGNFAVAEILNKHANLPKRGLRMIDGSGLSRDNASTPEQFMHVLEYAYQNGIRDDFIKSLPIAGLDGTLKRRSGNFTRRVYAKTGSMSGIMSLAGYAVNHRNETLAFVFIFNGKKNRNWQFRQQEDRILEILMKS